MVTRCFRAVYLQLNGKMIDLFCQLYRVLLSTFSHRNDLPYPWSSSILSLFASRFPLTLLMISSVSLCIELTSSRNGLQWCNKSAFIALFVLSISTIVVIAQEYEFSMVLTSAPTNTGYVALATISMFFSLLFSCCILSSSTSENREWWTPKFNLLFLALIIG